MEPSFSPSIVHQHLMDQNKPAMQFAGENFDEWRDRLHPVVHKLVGLSEFTRTPLRTKTIWKREHPLGRIEKIVFSSELFSDIPAYTCIPDEPIHPGTWIICLQGHTSGMHNSIAVSDIDEVTPINVEGDRDFAIGCMKQGVAALCIEQRAFGERREQDQEHSCSYNGCLDPSMHALMLGRTMIGERVYDVDRALDYLESRNDVDMQRIGIMGNSGGGTISLFSAALLNRIAFTIPSCYFCTFRDSIMSIYHCPDNFIPGLLQVAEMADILGLFAPKPVLIVAGKEDEIFPIAGTQKAFKALKAIYSAAGAADQCHLLVGQGGHRFYAKEAWPIIRKIIQQL
jgi:dienelactone hydrolase